MRPVSAEFSVSQNFGDFATEGVAADPNGTEVQQLVAMYGNYQPFGHAGQDIACPIGTPIYAIADGTVLYAGWGEDLPGDNTFAGWASRFFLYQNFPGIVTVIQYDPGWIGVIAHQSNNDAVKAGDRVTEGQQIGLSGNTKTRTSTVGPHVHSEALVNTSYVTGNGLIYGRTNPEPFYGSTTAEDDLMATPEDRQALIAELMTHPVKQPDGVVTNLESVISEYRSHVTATVEEIAAVAKQLSPEGRQALIAELLTHPVKQPDGVVTNLESVVSEYRSHVTGTIDAITKAIAAQDAPAIAQAIPADLAQAVVTALFTRFAAAAAVAAPTK